MQFAELAETLGELEKTSARNAMTEILAVLIGKLDSHEVRETCYLLLGSLGPAYDRIDFQLADKMVVRALALLGKVEQPEIWREYKAVGDLGLVALRQAQGKPAPKEALTVSEVYTKLMLIARESGQGSQERKIEGLAELIKDSEAISAKYIVRIVLGRLRLGFSDKTILDALSVMNSGGKGAREKLETAYQIYPDIGELAFLVKSFGVRDLEKRVKIKLGVPVMPALCQRLKSSAEMIEKMGVVFVEPKFDGTRVQIHIKKIQDSRFKIQDQNRRESQWEVKTFTRNLEETTWMFPELQRALNQIEAEAVILDSEAVGFDPKTGRMLPFQETITRKRKHEVEAAIGRVPLKFNVFDLLLVNGRSLINEPLDQRRRELLKVVRPGETLKVVDGIRTTNPQELKEFHAKKLNEGYEGVVVKQVGGAYEPGRRGFNWVKFKEVEEAAGKLVDTIDAVVMGFYRGKGKRVGFGLGAFLVGIRGKGEAILTLAKIGTGLTDEQWREMKRRLDEQVCLEPPKSYQTDKMLIPDVWVEPKIVVEIAADEITKSPVHSAQYALRFPRLVKFRDDKDIRGVTTVEELMKIRG